MGGKKKLSHSVYELLCPGLEAVHLEAALHPLIGAHNGRVVVSPALLQRPPTSFTRLPATQVLHRANSGSIRYLLSLQKPRPCEVSPGVNSGCM